MNSIDHDGERRLCSRRKSGGRGRSSGNGLGPNTVLVRVFRNNINRFYDGLTLLHRMLDLTGTNRVHESNSVTRFETFKPIIVALCVH